MARIRTTKPEFWTDGDVMDLSPQARQLFHGSWNFTLCDWGHLPDDPRRLKMQVLPADDVMMVRDASAPLGWTLAPLDAAALVEEILASGRMARLEVDGRSYLHIVRFTEHQKIDKRWTPRCPVCRATSTDHPKPRRTSREFGRTPRTSAPDRTGQDRTAAAAAAEEPQPPQPVDNLPTAVAIFRDKMHAHTALQALRFDGLHPTRLRQLEDLIALHGDQRLIDTALRTLRTPPPVHVTAFLGTWAALPEPGQRLRVVKAYCETHTHTELRADGTCGLCIIDAKVGDV